MLTLDQTISIDVKSMTEDLKNIMKQNRYQNFE